MFCLLWTILRIWTILCQRTLAAKLSLIPSSIYKERERESVCMCVCVLQREMATESVDFYVLPEGCVANILSMTSPRDVCRLSLVSSIFRSAGESDVVWERFLPSDYQDMIARSIPSSHALYSFSKKDLYYSLCNFPLIIEEGNKSFSLEKTSGKKCYMLAAKDLLIVWGDTPNYWTWFSHPESRFSEVAELISVCWFEIRGKINTSMLSPDTIYAAYLVFKSTPGAYGFEYQPSEVSVGIIGGESEVRTVYLDPEGGQKQWYRVPRRVGPGLFSSRLTHMRLQPSMPREGDGRYPNVRADRWLEIELGEFTNKRGEDGELEMSVTEVKGGNWKGGLIIQGIEIRPKEGK